MLTIFNRSLLAHRNQNCQGSALAMQYMHAQNPTITNRDFGTANTLLDGVGYEAHNQLPHLKKHFLADLGYIMNSNN